VKWKLHTRNEGLQPPLEEWELFETREAALDRACDTLRHQRHKSYSSKDLTASGSKARRLKRGARHEPTGNKQRQKSIAWSCPFQLSSTYRSSMNPTRR
jgi:hypothetical protein